VGIARKFAGVSGTDMRHVLRRRYGVVCWRRLRAEFFVVLLLGVGVAFCSTIVSLANHWVSAEFFDIDVLNLGLADRSFLITCVLALSIPAERFATNLINRERYVGFNTVMICFCVVLIFFGLLMASKGSDFGSLSALQVRDLLPHDFERVSRTKWINTAFAANIPALIALSTLGKVGERD
jgi:hypothetical protein